MTRYVRTGIALATAQAPPPAGAPPAAAQAPARSPNDTVVSPDVQADGRVTFRIYAPKATEDGVRGDWMEVPGPVALQKDAQGIWRVTLGPLAADSYSCTLTVDGVRTLNPKNASIK